MAYKNVNRRISILVKSELIEEVPYTKRTKHGAVDHRLTMKGLEYLIPHFLAHPEEMKGLFDYMDRFGQNKQVFVHKLINQMIPQNDSTKLFLESILTKSFELTPMNTAQIEHLQRSMIELGNGLEKYRNKLLHIEQKIVSSSRQLRQQQREDRERDTVQEINIMEARENLALRKEAARLWGQNQNESMVSKASTSKSKKKKI